MRRSGRGRGRRTRTWSLRPPEHKTQGRRLPCPLSSTQPLSWVWWVCLAIVGTWDSLVTSGSPIPLPRQDKKRGLIFYLLWYFHFILKLETILFMHSLLSEIQQSILRQLTKIFAFRHFHLPAALLTSAEGAPWITLSCPVWVWVPSSTHSPAALQAASPLPFWSGPFSDP